jgi:hypothetical protein
MVGSLAEERIDMYRILTQTPSLLIVFMGDSPCSLKETVVVAVGLQVSVPEYFLERYLKNI